MTKEIASRKRNLAYIELLRTIAIFLVMFNHTGEKGFLLFYERQDSLLYGVYLFASIGCKVAVPIFFMISGALLLGKEESIRYVYRKRVAKFLFILLSVSLFYQVYDCIFNNKALSISSFLVTVYSYNASTALWYLYSYIGALMMLPLLRKMVKNMRSKDYVYIFLCHIVIAGVIPILQFLLSHGMLELNISFKADIFTSRNIFFLLMGYFLEKVLDEKYYTLKNTMIFLAAGFLSIVLCCVMTNYQILITDDYDSALQTFHNCLISVPACSMFFCTKYFFLNVKVKESVNRFIRCIGGTSFGIYLLERVLRQSTVGVYDFLQPIIHTLPACLVWIASAFVIGVIVTLILKKMPLVKEFV